MKHGEKINWKSISDLRDNIKHSNIHAIGMSEREERTKNTWVSNNQILPRVSKKPKQKIKRIPCKEQQNQIVENRDKEKNLKVKKSGKI